jgi:hypothetical protein
LVFLCVFAPLRLCVLFSAFPSRGGGPCGGIESEKRRRGCRLSGQRAERSAEVTAMTSSSLWTSILEVASRPALSIPCWSRPSTIPDPCACAPSNALWSKRGSPRGATSPPVSGPSPVRLGEDGLDLDHPEDRGLHQAGLRSFLRGPIENEGGAVGTYWLGSKKPEGILGGPPGGSFPAREAPRLRERARAAGPRRSRATEADFHSRRSASDPRRGSRRSRRLRQKHGL